jgi:amino acid transporter
MTALEIQAGEQGRVQPTSPSPEFSSLNTHLLVRFSSHFQVVRLLTNFPGFDASAHLSEETRNAARSAPIGVITSIAVSSVFGFFLILCLLFSIQDFHRTVTSAYEQPVVQIFVDVFGPKGAIAGMTLIMVCVWHCGLFSITSNSRMMYAFSRDRALPHFFDHVDKRFQSPVRTIWLAATLAFILALPSLGSAVAFSAATSIATIGLYISYSIPILIAVIWPSNFVKGPFNLGVMSRPVGIVACTWGTPPFFFVSTRTPLFFPSPVLTFRNSRIH